MSFLNLPIQLQSFTARQPRSLDPNEVEQPFALGSPITAIVGEGIEFSELLALIGGDAIATINVDIDISDDSILFDFRNSASPGFAPGSYRFSDSSELLPAIQNVTIAQPSSLLGEFDIEFTEDSITINPKGIFLDTNSFVTLDVEFEGDFVRFQNSNAPEAYIYATGNEVHNIRNNFPDFVEEGIAFNAAIEPDDELIPFYRFQNNQISGAYLFVGEEERNNINASPNFSNIFTEEGIAFYVFGVGTDQETTFSRFQNSDVPGTYIYATGIEADNIRNNLPGFIDEGIAFETEI